MRILSRYFFKAKKPIPACTQPPCVSGLIGPQREMVPLHERMYNQDGLATIHSTAFAREPVFASAYQAGYETGSWGEAQIHWRAHVVCWAASQSLNVPGDFVECGTNRGGTAMVMIRYLGTSLESRTFYLFDTFKGLDNSLSSAEEMKRLEVYYPDCYEEVAARFRPYQHVKVIRGSVPDVLHTEAPQKIAFLHIDLNAAGPERAAMDFLWPRLSPGALVVFDDYGWVACVEQKKTLDDFALNHGTRILSLPTGQGLLIKNPV